MVQLIGPAVGQDEATADMAIAYAVEWDWLIAAGNPPHGICLMDYGRATAASVPERRRQPGSSAER
jgi:hypothetical protein